MKENRENAAMALQQEDEADEDQALLPRHSSLPTIKGNIGFKLLQKSGWKEGTGLGASEQGRLEPLDVVVKNDKRGIGASTLPANKKLCEAPKQRKAGTSEKKKGSECKQSKKASKRLKKELAREKELQEQVFQRNFFREFWPENV